MTIHHPDLDLAAPDPSARLVPPIAAAVLAAWFALIVLLARTGVFVPPPGQPPAPLLVAILTPAALFYALYRVLEPVRAWVHALDLATVTATQSWRVIGATMLMLWGLDELPAVFAAPAGFGDVAVGLFAALVAVQIARRAGNWGRSAYLVILAGMADFVVAVGTGVLSREGWPLAFPGEPVSTLMLEFPMGLIPAFGVPLFIVLHLIAWLKLRVET